MEGMPTIDIPKDRAEIELKMYKKIRREHRRKEDEAFMQAYRAAAKGSSVIDAGSVLAWAGVHEDTQLPKLAIARADAEIVHYRNHSTWHDGNDCPHFTTSMGTSWGGEQFPDWEKHGWRKHQRFPALADAWVKTGHRGYRTPVPVIPPSLRPPWKLSNYHILWEVPSWERIPLRKSDPLLLKHIRADLYAVLAAWDMTPLEAAILNERLA